MTALNREHAAIRAVETGLLPAVRVHGIEEALQIGRRRLPPLHRQMDVRHAGRPHRAFVPGKGPEVEWGDVGR